MWNRDLIGERDIDILTFAKVRKSLPLLGLYSNLIAHAAYRYSGTSSYYSAHPCSVTFSLSLLRIKASNRVPSSAIPSCRLSQFEPAIA
jgi:hypothetical protein